MLKRLLAKLKGFFTSSKPKTQSQPHMTVGSVDGGVVVRTQAQLDKRTHFKPGETYRLGEAIVTVHATKASMLKAIAAVDAKRAAREAALRERAIEIMLMTPDQLRQFKITEWLDKRKQKHSLIRKIVGFSGKRYIPPSQTPISGDVKERFKELATNSKDMVKVK